MDTFGEIADERRAMADLMSGLTAEQRATQSLCTAWTVHDVAAHLIVSLEVSLPKFMVSMVASGGSFDRANLRLTSKQARRPVEDIVDILRRKAESRFTPPGAGPEAPLSDLLVHGLDVRWPLGIARSIPAERAQKALTFLASSAANGLAPKGGLDGLRFEADDLDWTHGSGPTVRGSSDALLLALTGRTAALQHLEGDGVPTLSNRLS